MNLTLYKAQLSFGCKDVKGIPLTLDVHNVSTHKEHIPGVQLMITTDGELRDGINAVVLDPEDALELSAMLKYVAEQLQQQLQREEE